MQACPEPGWLLYFAHVPRHWLIASASSFTSLRRTASRSLLEACLAG